MNQSRYFVGIEEYSEALACIDKAIAADKMNIEFYIQKGIILANMDKLDAAIQEFNNALKIDKKYAEAYFHLGNIFIMKEERSKGDKPMAQIRITPEELRDAADFLEQRLDAINTEVTALHDKIEEVAGNWEGAAQSSFVDTFENDMYPILRDTLPQVVEGISGQLDGAADTIEQADEEIAKAFKG